MAAATLSSAKQLLDEIGRAQIDSLRADLNKSSILLNELSKPRTPPCTRCGGTLKWAHDRDMGVCPLGHRISGEEMYRTSKVDGLQKFISTNAGGGQPLTSSLLKTYHDTVLNRKVEHMEYTSDIERLIAARDAGLLTDAEARAVVLEMFPAAKRLADARALVASADQPEA